MSDWPKSPLESGLGYMAISPFSPLSLGPSVTRLANNTTQGTQAWPAANRVLLVPFRLPEIRTAYQIVVGTSTTAGNFDAGIYDTAGNRIIAAGSTAKNAGNEVVCNITDTAMLPGYYYMALQVDGTTSMIGIAAAQAGLIKAMGVLEANPGAFPLPATLTYATNQGTIIPTGISIWFRST